MTGRLVNRGLFGDLPESAAVPVGPKTKPGQPGATWRDAGGHGWVRDNRDGSRVFVGEGGRVAILKPGKVLA